MSFFRNWYYLWSKRTSAESALEDMICRLGEPYRAEHPFPSLRRVADFTLPRRKVVIEVDGASHLAPPQRRKDLVSTIALEKMGWRVIRFSNPEVLAGLDLAREIELRLTSRPTLPALEEALRQLPELPGPPPKKRERARAPGPKSVRKKKERKAHKYE